MGLFDSMNSALEEYHWGLDFGTYRSVVSYISEGSAPKVPNYQDACMGGVPSLFWRDQGGIEHVGDEVQAMDALLTDPAGVCSSVKTRLTEKEIRLHGVPYSPSEIAVRIIQRLLTVSRQLLDQEFIPMDMQRLVVGVPVRFNAAQRGEIVRIVRRATGLDDVVPVPEPILAALCIDYFQLRAGNKEKRPLLVYDMGAGTFDAVVLKRNEKPTLQDPYPYVALSPEGNQIAGDRMDQRMEELILDKLQQSGCIDMSVLKNEQHQDRIQLRTYYARKAKETLSRIPEMDLRVSGVECGNAQIHITREEYTARIRDDVAETVELAAQVAKNAGVWGEPALDVLMVGGSTYIPLIREMLLKKFHWLEESDIQQRYPEKAVALGAALYAAEPEAVLPKVVYGYAVDTNVSDEVKLCVCIPPNAKLPMTTEAGYRTINDNQTSVGFTVYEVDHGEEGEILDLEEGKKLAYHISHKFGREVPIHTSVRLKTTLTPGGLLTMSVDDNGISSGTEKEFNLTNSQIGTI